MAAQEECEICEEPDDMMTTYADAITLLMAFFVMLLTFAEYDVPAYQEAAAAIAENIGAGIHASYVKREHCGQQLWLAMSPMVARPKFSAGQLALSEALLQSCWRWR